LHKNTTASEFLQSFTNTLDFLVKNTNKKIIVFLNAPVGGNPKSCVIRPFSITNKPNTCDIPLVDAIASNGNAKSIITNVLKSYPMVSIYDPADFLCKNGSCKIINGKNILYIDSGHMSKLGGEYLANESKLKLDSIFFPNH
jgi:hypothetical protein